MESQQRNQVKGNTFQKKGFSITYDPENNKNNIYARKLNRNLPKEDE